MEEDEIELIDYLRVIWKRKLLIIMGTLVCIVAGGVMTLRLPVRYHAEVLMRIGKTVDIGPVSFSPPPPSFVLHDTLENLVKTIPVEYAIEDEEASEYDLNVEVVKKTSLIKIVLEGPDERKTKELFNEVVEKLTDDHLRKTESNIQFYKVLIEKRETDIEKIQNDSAREALEVEEMNIEVDKEMNILMNKEKNVELDINEADPFTSMMIQNRLIALQNNILRMKESAMNNLLRMKQVVQNNLKQSRIDIRSIRDDIFRYQLTINTLKKNKTKLVGEMKSTAIEPKKKRNIILAGVVGLMMSLFLAFFIEYLGSVREKNLV